MFKHKRIRLPYSRRSPSLQAGPLERERSKRFLKQVFCYESVKSEGNDSQFLANDSDDVPFKDRDQQQFNARPRPDDISYEENEGSRSKRLHKETDDSQCDSLLQQKTTAFFTASQQETEPCKSSSRQKKIDRRLARLQAEEKRRKEIALDLSRFLKGMDWIQQPFCALSCFTLNTYTHRCKELRLIHFFKRMGIYSRHSYFCL